MTSNNLTDVPLTLEDLSPRQVAETHYRRS